MVAILERRMVRIPLLFAFGALCLIIALVFTFPGERVKQIVIVQAEKALQHKYDIAIGDLDLWWLSGVELHQVKITERWSDAQKEQAERDAARDAAPKMPMQVVIPRVAVRAAPLSSLFSLGGVAKFAVDFEEGGIITGDFTQKTSKREINVRFDQVDMLKAGILTNLTGLPGFGTLSGDISLELDPKRPVLVAGSFDLSGSKITIGPGGLETDKLPAMAFIEVPQTNFGNMTFKAKIAKPSPEANPTFTIETFETLGRDIRSEAWGDVMLGATAPSSRANLMMRLQFDEGFVKENSLAPILNMGLFREGKSAQNWYGISFLGGLSTMRPRGSLAAARGPKDQLNAPSPDATQEDAPAARPTPARPARVTPPRAVPPPVPAPEPEPEPEPELLEPELEVIEEEASGEESYEEITE